jgi:TRAP-type transport system periplasmic protein
MQLIRLSRLALIPAVALFVLASATAQAQQPRNFRFAYDQPKNTGYGIVGDVFAEKLKELSKGTMLIDQYPGAQLGQEPQVLQLVKAGDIDFCISASANAATLSPQAGVMSLHFLFRSEDHLKNALADPEVAKAVKQMIAETVQGAHVIALATLGLRSMYSKKEIRKVEDMKGLMGRRPCICRSAAFTPLCRRAWWMSPRTASTSISSTSTMRWHPYSR